MNRNEADAEGFYGPKLGVDDLGGDIPEKYEMENGDAEAYIAIEDVSDPKSVENTLRAFESFDRDFGFVHIPWEDGQGRRCTDYLNRTYRIAESLGADVIFDHPNVVETWYDEVREKVDEIERVSGPDVLYETKAATGFGGLDGAVLERGERPVIDVAHLWLGENLSYRDPNKNRKEFREKLNGAVRKSIEQDNEPLIHLASTDWQAYQDDSAPLGDRDLPLDLVTDIIESEGLEVIVETKPEFREESWNNLAESLEHSVPKAKN